MIWQSWVNERDWEKTDPKLGLLRSSPLILPHTKRLADSVPLKPSGILIVRGPRQTGKSTFLRQLAQKALLQKIPAENMGLIEAESLGNRQDLLGEISNFCAAKKGYCVLLIDEITAIQQWWLSLKIASDQGLLSRTLVVATGSSSLDLEEGADLLPGRRGKRHPVDYELLPVRYRDVAAHLSLEDFFLTGGMPWAITEFLRSSSIPPFVYELYGAWIRGTLVKKKHSVQNLAPMLHYLAERVGTGTSVTSLARDCGFGSNHTAEAYLSILEMNYIVMPCRWSQPGSAVVAPRKNRKFYPADPLLLHLFADYGTAMDSAFARARQRVADPRQTGALVEALVASELRHVPAMVPLRYFLGRREIDFVGDSAVEVKYRNKVDLAEFAWAKRVLPKGMRLTVVTKNTHSAEGNVRAVPLHDWLLENK